ncbi:MAG: hypothetical protein ACKOPT_11985 [Cyanobium sp.]
MPLGHGRLPALLTLLGPELQSFLSAELPAASPLRGRLRLEQWHRLIRQQLTAGDSSRWLQRSQRVGRKCSTWRPSLIHASLGDSGGRLRG